MKIRNIVRYWKIRRAVLRISGHMEWFGYSMPKESILASYKRWRRGLRRMAPVVRAAGISAEDACANLRLLTRLLAEYFPPA